MVAQRGSLVIADIGGYTSYLTSVELEHSHDILADLVDTVVANLGSLFRLAKLEGDAVFCYDTNESPNGASVLAAIEGTYFAFRRRLRDIAHLTTCSCNACRTIPALDLKFVAHHGEFILHQVAGNSELLGPDVIGVHRLLKNTITESTGLKGYAFLSDACIDRCTLDPTSMGLKPHTEHYEDVGDLSGYLIDLADRWRIDQERTAVFVATDTAAFTIEDDFPPSPAAMWDLVTAPERAYEWFVGLESLTENNPSGLRGVGTVNHCVHGGMAIDNEIVDWKPFHYWTQRTSTPVGPMLMTVELTPVGSGTRLAYRVRFESALAPEMLAVAVQMIEQQIRTNADGIKRVASGMD